VQKKQLIVVAQHPNSEHAHGEKLGFLPALDAISEYKVIIIGENNSGEAIVGLETKIIKKLTAKQGNVHVILQHFNFEMQYLIDEFVSKKITF
jgi:uncharacterized iron-regulated protein